MIRTHLTLFVILGLLFVNATAAPKAPLPLRALIAQSEYIIFGHVVATYPLSTDNPPYTGVAGIAVVERLKGAIPEDIINVPFYRGFDSPTIEKYYDSTLVIAFLTKVNGSYQTFGGASGAKTLSPEDIKYYKLKIAEFQAIEALAHPDSQFHQTIEWIVQCAENTSTHQDAIRELTPKNSFIASYVQAHHLNTRTILTLDQKKRLKKYVLSSKEPETINYDLLHLIYQGNEDEFDKFLIGKQQIIR
ncbi:MAG: hypothetical protein U0264_19190 [Candidatus Kapaibacterium sp.]